VRSAESQLAFGGGGGRSSYVRGSKPKLNWQRETFIGNAALFCSELHSLALKCRYNLSVSQSYKKYLHNYYLVIFCGH
jgi:hypothetical protein